MSLADDITERLLRAAPGPRWRYTIQHSVESGLRAADAELRLPDMDDARRAELVVRVAQLEQFKRDAEWWVLE